MHIIIYLREKHEWDDELDGFEEHPEEIEKAGSPGKHYLLPLALRDLRKSQEVGKRRWNAGQSTQYEGTDPCR